MRFFGAFSRTVDLMNERIGQCAAWSLFIAICVSAGNAFMRKFFNMSSNAWLELQWYLFGAVFMFCAPWTLRLNEHIRIDVLADRLSQRARNWIDVFGHIFFLLIFCVLMVFLSWPVFLESFRSSETSASAGGLVLWPPKLMILVGFALIALQGASELIKRIEIIRAGHGGDDRYSSSSQDAEAGANPERSEVSVSRP